MKSICNLTPCLTNDDVKWILGNVHSEPTLKKILYYYMELIGPLAAMWKVKAWKDDSLVLRMDCSLGPSFSVTGARYLAAVLGTSGKVMAMEHLEDNEISAEYVRLIHPILVYRKACKLPPILGVALDNAEIVANAIRRELKEVWHEPEFEEVIKIFIPASDPIQSRHFRWDDCCRMVVKHNVEMLVNTNYE